MKTRTALRILPISLASYAPQNNREGGRKLTPCCMFVFSVVPQTEKLQSKVMHSVINMIQEDFEPVSRKAERSGWEGRRLLS